MKLLILIITTVSLAGCVKTIQPMPPTSLTSSYRKTVEVLLVSCDKPRRSGGEYISIVETTDTGERFQLHGCYGKTGDRFKISY